MDDLLAARSQMAMSLAFHIIFAAIGIAMPLLMIVAEWKWLRSKDEIYLTLAQRWARGAAILFAVGAVSGTVLSFELGLLWPPKRSHPFRGSDSALIVLLEWRRWARVRSSSGAAPWLKIPCSCLQRSTSPGAPRRPLCNSSC